jgi:hypothetical protein
MAAPTAVILSGTRVNEFPPTGFRRCVEAQLTVDGTVGAALGSIPASTFKLKYIEQCSNLVKSDNSAVVGANPSYDGSSLLTLGTLGGATSTPTNLAAGTYGVVMEGY